MPDALGVLVKLLHRPIRFRQSGDAANGFRFLQTLITHAIRLQAREVFKFLPWQFSILKTQRTEHCLHAIKILGGNRVELVIMAFRTAQFGGEKRDADRVDHVIEILLTSYGLHAHRRMLPRAHAQETCGNHVIGVVGLELIAGNLLAYKLVIRLVGIKRAHHIIAIAPCVWPRVVVGKAR